MRTVAGLALLLCLSLGGCATPSAYSVKRTFRADTVSLTCVRSILGSQPGVTQVDEHQASGSDNRFWFGRDSLSITRKPDSRRVVLEGVGFPDAGEPAATVEQRRGALESTLAEIELRCAA